MEYRMCKKCVMDTTDSQIKFDENGVCNHCRNAEALGKKIWFPNEVGSQKLNAILSEIKENGKNKKYDAIVGLSGGIDSSYIVYKAKEWGLRLLAVHVDGGWNTDISVNNVKTVCEYANVDLKIVTIDWEDMKKMQLAFLKAAVPNQDIPQDHAFFTVLYSYAVENDIKYVLNGSNWETESILPRSWGYNAMDGKHVSDIYKKNGDGIKTNFPIIDLYKVKIYYPYVKKMKIVKPLNLMPYNKEKAMKELIDNTEWRYYGGKHYESVWTKFLQAYYLPTKFNIDKRRAHLSSLIVSNQITREEALAELEKPLYDPNEIEKEKEIIADKLEISIDEFNQLLSIRIGKHSDYYCTGDSLLYKMLFKINKAIK
ncbi:N-acetyl sugar amidotransferase [Lysinibacillus capsici]|uniref:N-acetyl sugar amidotransferase n=1 Tax=Lysinibacillus capsici TaxID=2115968 RepID=UPI003BAA5D82